MVAGANVHDTKLLEATLEAIVVQRPQPTDEAPQHLCLDKGYDNPTGHQAAAAYGYQAHIRRIGEEKLDSSGEKTHPGFRSTPSVFRSDQLHAEIWFPSGPNIGCSHFSGWL